jgi:hypothetical protein
MISMTPLRETSCVCQQHPESRSIAAHNSSGVVASKHDAVQLREKFSSEIPIRGGTLWKSMNSASRIKINVCVLPPC